VKPWFDGFDYKEAFRVCNIPYEKAKELAYILCTKTWGMHQDLGIFCGRNNTMNSYLLLMLMAFTGNLLYKGNIVQDYFASRGDSVNENDPAVWRTLETNRFPVLQVYPTGVLGQEILSENPVHLRCIFCSMGNPARVPGQPSARQGIRLSRPSDRH